MSSSTKSAVILSLPLSLYVKRRIVSCGCVVGLCGRNEAEKAQRGSLGKCSNYHVCRDLYIPKISKKKAERKDMSHLCNASERRSRRCCELRLVFFAMLLVW